MRIDIIASARRHGITDAEIRTVTSYPALRIELAPRRAGSMPVLHIGASAETEPYLEVIADFAEPDVMVVFHAMVLRRSLVAGLGLSAIIDDDSYGSQRRIEKDEATWHD